MSPSIDPRHIDVSKYQRDIYSTFKYCNGLVSVSRLDRNKSRIFYNLDGEQPEKPIVLDHQNNGEQCCRFITSPKLKPEGRTKQDVPLRKLDFASVTKHAKAILN